MTLQQSLFTSLVRGQAIFCLHFRFCSDMLLVLSLLSNLFKTTKNTMLIYEACQHWYIHDIIHK
ncbi:hypothetical protein T07_3414 [Trichinella nelsoni]|uniref:Uncharacterized protein n=1 Tax=Trichinella nelsoni TaxID=6336 RepID=A0A0V0S7M3_9BILA|nr:hypothetical protein T07_3414 [Trichinella nelsoni]